MTKSMEVMATTPGVSLPTVFASRVRREAVLHTSGTPPTAQDLQTCSWCTVVALERRFVLFEVKQK